MKFMYFLIASGLFLLLTASCKVNNEIAMSHPDGPKYDLNKHGTLSIYLEDASVEKDTGLLYYIEEYFARREFLREESSQDSHIYNLDLIPYLDFTRMKYKIVLSKQNSHIYSWECHRWSAFIITDDGILIRTEYSPLCTGCKLVCFDLVQRKELWTSKLQGLGPIFHSRYKNIVAILGGSNQIIIIGNECGGKYIELVDIETGDTLFNARLLDHKYEVTVDKLSSTTTAQ